MTDQLETVRKTPFKGAWVDEAVNTLLNIAMALMASSVIVITYHMLWP